MYLLKEKNNQMLIQKNQKKTVIIGKATNNEMRKEFIYQKLNFLSNIVCALKD